MNNLPIAFFDSGVGGLTVFKTLKLVLPNEKFIYFGDLKNIPYGEKSKQELIEIADEIFKYFERIKTKAVVMACNTTSANTYEELKDKYNFKIYPIIQSCASIISKMKIQTIGVFATDATVKSGVYRKELKKYNPNLNIIEKSCPPWVSIVENNLQDTKESAICIKNYLEDMLAYKPDKIILGCTHYPYLLDILSKFAPRDLFIDPAIPFAEYIKNDLTKNELLSDGLNPYEIFQVSANPENFQKAGSMFYPINSTPKLVIPAF